MLQAFPRTQIDGLSVSRMIIGSNWILGYSHTSPAADKLIKAYHSEAEAVSALLCAYLQYGVDTLMIPDVVNPALMDGIKMAEDKTGQRVLLITTPILDVDDTADARKSAREVIRRCAKAGAPICFPHHSSTEQLVNKNKGTIDRLPDYLAMIREEGMIPGLSAHMPELVIYSDANEYDVQTYIQIYNCAGFLMQVEIEYINKVIWTAKKPVITIKPMAAGRVSPFVGLTFNWATIREQDMVAVGCLTPDEALEDIEISFAAIERRMADLEGRASPNKTDIML